jgi:hypothetical protein
VIDLKIEDEVVALRAELTKALQQTLSGLPAHQAFQAADHVLTVMQEQLAGARVVFPAGRKFDGDAIAADWKAGLSLDDITAKHGCSKPTAYRYHPAGKPKRAA